MMMNPNTTKAKHEVVSPATSLHWDNNGKDFEAVLGMEEDAEKDGGTGWKRAGNEKGLRGAKQGKTTGPVELDTLDSNNKQNVKEKIHERGEIAMDEETGSQTDVQIEWTMMDDCKKVNICMALIAILGKIQTMDNSHQPYLERSLGYTN
eukprot:3149864-Ditylum_brightwellii.AAC.1